MIMEPMPYMLTLHYMVLAMREIKFPITKATYKSHADWHKFFWNSRHNCISCNSVSVGFSVSWSKSSYYCISFFDAIF